MAIITTKLRSVHTGLLHWCPGCRDAHVLPTNRGWTYHGQESADRFTASPSFKHTWTWGPQREQRSCHYIITNGRLAFCTDCTHDLAGQTVDMPDFPDCERLGLPGCE